MTDDLMLLPLLAYAVFVITSPRRRRLPTLTETPAKSTKPENVSAPTEEPK